MATIDWLPREDIVRVFAWGKHRACLVTDTGEILVWTSEKTFHHTYALYQELDDSDLYELLYGSVYFVVSTTTNALHLLSEDRGYRILDYVKGDRLHRVIKQDKEYVNVETGEVYRCWYGGSRPSTDLLLYTVKGKPFWFTLCRDESCSTRCAVVTRPVHVFPVAGIDDFDLLVGCKVRVPFRIVMTVQEL